HSLAGPRSARGVLGELRRNGPSRDLLRPALDDNLLVGFHAGERPEGPAGAANAFVVHAGGARNGELRATVAGRAAPLHLGLQELDVTYVVVLREQGATYYVSGPAGASGLGAWPSMRPIAVDVTDATTSLFAGLHQSVHAEAHYELSSSVDEVHVADVADLARWCASALAADTFVGHGPLLGSSAEVGGVWAGASEGGFLRTGGGAAATGRGAAAQLELSAPAGLVHVLVHLSANPSEAASAGLT